MWYVYLLLCSDNTLYTGASDDPGRRLIVHMTGRGSKYTRSRRPLKIIYQERFSSRSRALKREAEIKSWPRNKKIRDLKLKIFRT